MLSLQKVCTAQDILELNQNKEYVLTASCLLKSVTADINLNAQAFMLWQILLDKAKFSTNLEIQISYSYLAQMLNKSTRTVQRYVKTLADNNYIVIKNNYLTNGGQTINTILVRFPTRKIEDAKQTKNRINYTSDKASHDKNVIGEGDKNVAQDNIININNNIINNNKPSLSIDSKKHNNSVVDNLSNTYVARGTYSDSTLDNLNKASKLQEELLLESEDAYADKFAKLNINRIKNDFNLSNTSKTIINTDNEKTEQIRQKYESYINNFIEIQGQIAELAEQQINNELIASELKLRFKKKLFAKLEQYYLTVKKEAQRELTKFTDCQHKSQISIALAKIESLCDVERLRLENLQTQVKQQQSEIEHQLKYQSDPYFMVEKGGIRPIARNIINRIKNNLKIYGIQDRSRAKLINEIVYEARFGSLINTNTTQEEMPIERSVNIALKLVREGRWSTPTLLNRYLSRE